MLTSNMYFEGRTRRLQSSPLRVHDPHAKHVHLLRDKVANVAETCDNREGQSKEWPEK